MLTATIQPAILPALVMVFTMGGGEPSPNDPAWVYYLDTELPVQYTNGSEIDTELNWIT